MLSGVSLVLSQHFDKTQNCILPRANQPFSFFCFSLQRSHSQDDKKEMCHYTVSHLEAIERTAKFLLLDILQNFLCQESFGGGFCQGLFLCLLVEELQQHQRKRKTSRGLTCGKRDNQ